MKFLLFLSVWWIFTDFSYSQTAKIVARKSCDFVEKCSDLNNFTGPNRGLVWSGVTIYDWGDHDNNPSTLDTLGWSQCAKATIRNSGSASKIREDNCTCASGFTKNPSNCVGQTSCECICNRNCSGNLRLNSSNCSCYCPSSTISCPHGYALNNENCSCECNQTCEDGYILTDTCSCRCNRSCPSGFILNQSTCTCEPNTPGCTPQSCTPSKICSDGSTIQGDTLSGIRQCDSNGNLSSVCTGGTYSNSCPTCTSNSDCETCERCSAGRCINKTTSWTPAWDKTQHCPDASRQQTRCQNGVQKSQTLTGTKDCSISCEETRPCQGVGKIGMERGIGTRVTPGGACDVVSWDKSGCRDCSGPCREYRAGQCINKTTSWTPAWDKTQHCPDASRQQTRCQNGVQRSQTIHGTKSVGCGPSRCTPPNKMCPNAEGKQKIYNTNSGTMVNGVCTDATYTETPCPCTPPNKMCPNAEGKQKIYNTNSGTMVNGVCKGGTLKKVTDCCVPVSCTPANKACPEEQTGTQTGISNSGTRECVNEVLSEECTGGSWDDSACRTVSTTCRPANKTCDGGVIQTPTDVGTYKCKQLNTNQDNPGEGTPGNSGPVPDGEQKCSCEYSGGWTPSECPSNSNCTPIELTDTCPSSHPFKRWVIDRGRKVYTCSRCQFDSDYGDNQYGQPTCCPSNPNLFHPCRRIVEVRQVQHGMSCKEQL